MNRVLWCALVVTLLAMTLCCHARDGYPKIANLWGCSAGATDYDKWARYDLLVMGGGSPEAWRTFREQTTRRNPRIRLLGTAPLMNIGPPASTPWMKDEWFLRRPNGEKVNWWAGQIYGPNLLNDGCLAALVGQTDQAYGQLLKDGLADGVFYDSVVGGASWYGEIDTNGDGKADVPTEVDPKWHARQCTFFDRLRERWPKILVLANDVDFGHAPHLNGRLFEGGPLLDQAANGSLSARQAVDTLNRWMKETAQPGITFAIMTHSLGWQGWRVGQGDKVSTPGECDRVRRDFARMRLGLVTTLMTDAYFAYDFGTVWYGLPFWYAEYDAPLGQSLGPSREVFEVPPVTVFEWSAGQAADAFASDASKATPQGLEGTTTETQWVRLLGTDPRKLPLEPKKTYRIEAECEVLRKPGATFQFNVRTGKGGWEKHDKAVTHCAGEAGTAWNIVADAALDDFEDYALEWHVLGGGALRVKYVKVLLVSGSYFAREFAGGVALLNPGRQPITVALKRPLKRLTDDAAPRHIVEVDDGAAGFMAEGAWESRDGEDHYCGPGFRVSPKPGSTARWTFVAPSTDQYTIFAAIPGGKQLTDAAAYALAGSEAKPTMTLDQRKRDGGWVKLFEAALKEGQRYEVILRSGGTGLTAADAIRAESAARFNDGSPVERVTLAPLDGVVLISR